jgi:ADP-ribosyl-[dinitrogen reductase] hydrolase
MVMVCSPDEREDAPAMRAGYATYPVSLKLSVWAVNEAARRTSLVTGILFVNTPSETRVTEDQFLGALLGMAIGDALGVPLKGLSSDEIDVRHGSITGYSGDATNVTPAAPIGQISDKKEIALCLVESLTTNDGLLDPENINARLMFLVNGASREMMTARTIAGIEAATQTGGLVDVEGDDSPELSVATRGVPVGLLHAVGVFDPGSLDHESRLATRLSHRGSRAVLPLKAVAMLVVAGARCPASLIDWFDQQWTGDVVEQVAELRAIGSIVANSDTFESGVFEVVASGGEADTRGAVAGAIAGARFGASGIPQHLIDDLDARIYLTLAAPWFYRTALRRQGTVIDLRTVGE